MLHVEVNRITGDPLRLGDAVSYITSDLGRWRVPAGVQLGAASLIFWMTSAESRILAWSRSPASSHRRSGTRWPSGWKSGGGARIAPARPGLALATYRCRNPPRSRPGTPAFAFAYAVGRHLPELAVPIRLLAGGVAYSRVHTGVHYPGDVVIGSIVGAGTAAMVAAACDRLS